MQCKKYSFVFSFKFDDKFSFNSLYFRLNTRDGSMKAYQDYKPLNSLIVNFKPDEVVKEIRVDVSPQISLFGKKEKMLSFVGIIYLFANAILLE